LGETAFPRQLYGEACPELVPGLRQHDESQAALDNLPAESPVARVAATKSSSDLTRKRSRPFGIATVLVLAACLGITGFAMRGLQHHGEAKHDRQLAERAQQMTALFTSVADNIQTLLTTGAAVAEATDGSRVAFRRAVVPRLSDASILSNAVLLDTSGRRGQVLARAGSKPLLLDSFDTACWNAIRAIGRSGRMNVIKSDERGGMSVLGLAAAPRPGSRYVVYSEIRVPEVLRYGSAGDSEGLDYAFYLGGEKPKNLVASSTSDLPISDNRLVTRISLGGQRPLLVFGDSRGDPGFLIPVRLWLVLAGGLLLTSIITLLVEWNRRRRVTALGLVDDLRTKNAALDTSDKALRSAELRYRRLVEELPLITYVDAVDDVASTLYISPQIEDLLGWPAEHWTADPQHFLDALHLEDRQRFLDENREHNDSGRPFETEYRLVTRFGRTRWVLDQAVLEVDADGKPVQSRGFMLDITRRKEAELAQAQAQLELRRQAELNRHQALHDSLTSLPNRMLFRERIEAAIGLSRSSGEPVAVMLIDLNHFKEVNDTLGHQRGDMLLQGLGARLRKIVREEDTIARLGGDEFGVLAQGVAPEDALSVASDIRAALGEPVSVAGLDLEVGASFGIAVFPYHGRDVEELIRHADVALYRSKETHTPTVYAAEHDHYSPARLRLLTGLRRAITDGELVVHYQPQVTAGTAKVGAVEALVRWQHPELGLVMPDQFIPLAEHTDLIRPLTLQVLETALAQCRAWKEGRREIGMAVNVTARDLLDVRFPEEVATRLVRAAVNPELLTLEITENAVLTDPVRAHTVLTRLAGIGVRIAIDDFGVGHSSLAYLKRLPVHVLKIDKSFVLGMASDEDDAAIVRSTIDLAHNLGLGVIAEGVETEELWHRLTALECDAVQGHYFAAALPAEEVLEAISSLAPHSPADENVVEFPRATGIPFEQRQYSDGPAEKTAL